MRILHFADLHIGVENYSRPDPETGLSTRLLDFLSTLDEVVEFALSQEVDLVLFAGDAYKSRDPSQTHQREFARRIARLSNAGIPSFLLVGNHDLPHALGRSTALEIFRTLDVPGVFVGDRINTTVIPTPSGPLQIIAVPWINRSHLLTHDETRGMNLESISHAIEERITLLIEREVQNLDDSLPAVLAGHLGLTSAQTSSEQSMTVSRDYLLMPSAIIHSKLDYVALGHIHKHQILHREPLVTYPGSLQRVDFSEESDRKGFCVVDLASNRNTGQRLSQFHFQEVKARTFLTVDLTIDAGDTNPTESIVKSLARHHIKDTIIRLRIAMPTESEPLLHEEVIRASLREAHYIAAIAKDVSRDRRLRLLPENAQGLSPFQAVERYLEESRQVSRQRKTQLLNHARELIEEVGGNEETLS